MKTPIIIHHMAALDGQYPPNSLEAIRACLNAKAPVIEVDIVALAKDDYLLAHDPELESETTGSGAVDQAAPEQMRGLYLKNRNIASAYAPALLRDVVALFREFRGETRLQLDFKNNLPLTTNEPLERLVKIIEPLGERVIVSSCADWQLRRLRKLAPWLDLGFDVQFYLDWRTPGETIDPRVPPFKQGAYGYYDDHLLAVRRIWSTADYLADRYEMMTGLVSNLSTFYVDYRMLLQSLDDGFNTADFLHSYGIRLDAWTLDADKPPAAAGAPRLLKAGVDFFTTNTPSDMAALLKG